MHYALLGQSADND